MLQHFYGECIFVFAFSEKRKPFIVVPIANETCILIDREKGQLIEFLRHNKIKE